MPSVGGYTETVDRNTMILSAERRQAAEGTDTVGVGKQNLLNMISVNNCISDSRRILHAKGNSS